MPVDRLESGEEAASLRKGGSAAADVCGEGVIF
jgi:hypothetical protein